MNREKKELERLLSEISLFSCLPDGKRSQMAGSARTVRLKAGETLATQGKTPVEGVYIVRSGSLERYYENRGKRILGGRLGPGDVYGGASLLINAGLSIRTVVAAESSVLFCIPKKIFLECSLVDHPACERFADTLQHWMEDEAHAEVMGISRAMHFLNDTPPFSFLPETELEELASIVSTVIHPKGTVLFTQESSRIDALHIIVSGAAERYYEEKGEKKLRGRLGEGETYGGISLLINKGLVVRSLQTMEDTRFYKIPAKHFLDICRKHPFVSEYFTDTFGRRMLDQSYADLFRNRVQSGRGETGFFDHSIESLYSRQLVVCPDEQSVQQAARQMNRNRCSSVLVTGPTEDFIGIVTDNDLRRKVVAEGMAVDRPVSEVMSSPLIALAARSPIFEALTTMMHHNIRHVAVTGEDGRIAGVLTGRDLLRSHGNAPLFVTREIIAAEDFDQIAAAREEVPRLVNEMIDNGAKAENVTSIITAISDTVLQRIVELTLAEHQEPPCRFAFMIMGSEGRREQTLKTDQDNAIVYEDGEGSDSAHDFFLSLGEAICHRLDQAGYEFCSGGVMAQNPKWCQPLSRWKETFHQWIRAASSEDLLHASIFFDFRTGYGDPAIIEALRTSLFRSLEGWEGFFRHLVENALEFKPPLGFFRNFVVESKGEHRNQLDIKSAMTPIVDFARVYALKHRVAETNTLARLRKLRHLGVLRPAETEELEQSYCFLMQLRFVTQTQALVEEGRAADNYIHPDQLTSIQQTMLKEIFKRVGTYQAKMEFDFTGAM